jgi:hypothetical protein
VFREEDELGEGEGGRVSDKRSLLENERGSVLVVEPIDLPASGHPVETQTQKGSITHLYVVVVDGETGGFRPPISGGSPGAGGPENSTAGDGASKVNGTTLDDSDLCSERGAKGPDREPWSLPSKRGGSMGCGREMCSGARFLAAEGFEIESVGPGVIGDLGRSDSPLSADRFELGQGLVEGARAWAPGQKEIELFTLEGDALAA